jgi:hypothetical protein
LTHLRHACIGKSAKWPVRGRSSTHICFTKSILNLLIREIRWRTILTMIKECISNTDTMVIHNSCQLKIPWSIRWIELLEMRKNGNMVIEREEWFKNLISLYSVLVSYKWSWEFAFIVAHSATCYSRLAHWLRLTPVSSIQLACQLA